MNQPIGFSILTTYQDRKRNWLVRFLKEVLPGKFAFDFYWPLVLNSIIRYIVLFNSRQFHNLMNLSNPAVEKSFSLNLGLYVKFEGLLL